MIESSQAVDPILLLLVEHPLNTTFEPTEPLTEEEIFSKVYYSIPRQFVLTLTHQDIGQQVVQLISESKTPFATLKQMLNDFPKYASSIVRRVAIDPDLKDEIFNNSFKAQQGTNVVWLNGGVVSHADMTPFRYIIYA